MLVYVKTAAENTTSWKHRYPNLDIMKTISSAADLTKFDEIQRGKKEVEDGAEVDGVVTDSMAEVVEVTDQSLGDTNPINNIGPSNLLQILDNPGTLK